jgi:hypothetical protein
MRFSQIIRLVIMAVVAWSIAVLTGRAAVYTLSHSGPTALNKPSSIDINTLGGINNWIAGGVGQLNYHWFYYRVGNAGPELPLEALDNTPAEVYNAAARTLDVTYDNGLYSIRTVYRLTGGNTPNLTETITVHNYSGAALDFHFFQYSDFDLFGTPAGQSVLFSTNSVTGQYYKATQTDGSHTVTEVVNSANPAISHFEAGFFNATLSSLTDGGPTTLSDTTSAGVGNVTFAYQWDVNLANNTSFQLSKLLTIVPEPGVFSLFGISIVGAFISRRGRIKS